jgi:hypothetical protein
MGGKSLLMSSLYSAQKTWEDFMFVFLIHGFHLASTSLCHVIFSHILLKPSQSSDLQFAYGSIILFLLRQNRLGALKKKASI